MTQNNEKRFEKKEEEDRVEEAKSGWQPQPFVSTHSPLHSRIDEDIRFLRFLHFHKRFSRD